MCVNTTDLAAAAAAGVHLSNRSSGEWAAIRCLNCFRQQPFFEDFNHCCGHEPPAALPQALAFDGDFNLWVAGAAGLSLMTVDPAEIGDSYEPNSVGETILLTPGGAPIRLTVLQVRLLGPWREHDARLHAFCRMAAVEHSLRALTALLLVLTAPLRNTCSCASVLQHCRQM